MATRKKIIDIPFDIPTPYLLDEHFTVLTAVLTVLTAGAITLIKKYGIHLWVMIR